MKISQADGQLDTATGCITAYMQIIRLDIPMGNKILSDLLHHPKMGQAQSAQRRLFQPLQRGAQKLSQRAEAGDDVVIRAEDDGAFDEANR